MKTFYLTFFFITSIFQFNYAQKNSIKIDVSDNITKKTTTITPGKYKVVMTGIKTDEHYEIEIIKEKVIYERLSIEVATDSSKAKQINILNEKTIDLITINKEEDIIIKIDVFKTLIDTTTNSSTIVKEKTYVYTLKTEKRGNWQTTFGFNFIYLSKNNTYFSNSENDSYIITEGTNQNKYDFHPTIMFNWIPNNKYNIGFSGGIGYDLEKSLSVFSGISKTFNQNITLTAGIAFHNQKRLSSNYKEGDIIKEHLDFEQLHSDYIRVNPFISISFRLDKNPFKK